jgi:hypothetical protein
VSSIPLEPGCGICACPELFAGTEIPFDLACRCGHAVSEHSPVLPLDFGTISGEIDNVLISVSNKLEREWPPSLGSRESTAVVIGIYRLCWFAYKTIRYFSAQGPPDPNRWPEFVFSAPPIVRGILDAIANVIYLFQDDLSARTLEYEKRGWIEDHRRSQQHRERYRDDPAHKYYLDSLAAEELRIRNVLNLDDAEVAKLKRWPRFVDMISRHRPGHWTRIGADDRRKFLEYLDDWFYAEFSRDSHLSGPGLYRRAEVLLTERRLWSERDHKTVDEIRSDYLMAATSLMLALASELTCELKFRDVAHRLSMVWVRLAFHSPMTWELYRERHRERIFALIGSQ